MTDNRIISPLTYSDNRVDMSNYYPSPASTPMPSPDVFKDVSRAPLPVKLPISRSSTRSKSSSPPLRPPKPFAYQPAQLVAGNGHVFIGRPASEVESPKPTRPWGNNSTVALANIPNIEAAARSQTSSNEE